MTGKADFTEEEWDLVRLAPTTAGMVIVTADKGGMFKETFAMAKAYSEAHKAPGSSQLLDELVTSGPKRPHDHPHSFEELKQHALKTLGDALALVDSKAGPEEGEAYRGFIRGLMDRVARRHEEDGQQISPKEQAAIDEISGVLGSSA